MDSILSLSVDSDSESKYGVPDGCCDDDDLLLSWVSMPFEPFLRPRFLWVAGSCSFTVPMLAAVILVSLYDEDVDAPPYIVDGSLYDVDGTVGGSL